jgi:leucyl/phenylalanyl-tRNA--protein transferase
MPVFRIPSEHFFPHPALAEPNGLLGVGGDLDSDRLILAYRSGIFPWYSEGQPILWFSPNPRFVLDPKELHVPRSLKQSIRKERFRITMDQAFSQVVEQCSKIPREGQFGTWITQEMKDAYINLNEIGVAHSIEVWEGDLLVGGLYGVCVGNLFAGESMFAKRNDASKIAFVYCVQQFIKWGIELIDSQVHTDHLARFGAKEIERHTYLERIAPLVQLERPFSKWSFDEDFVVSYLK